MITPLVLGLLAIGFGAVEPLTVATFNVRGDFEKGVATKKDEGWNRLDGKHRKELVLRWVREADPDLLGTQEAFANQVAEIDAALPGHAVYAVGREDGASGDEHCAIYYRTERFTRLDAGTFWLSETPDRPSRYPGAGCKRVASWLVLEDRVNGGELLVLNTHWDHVSDAARGDGAGVIRDRLPALADGREVIVTGDLNAREGDASVQRLLSGEPTLVDSYRQAHPERSSDERTYHGYRGGSRGERIDFVFHTPGWRAIEAKIDRAAYEGRFPSDHYPVSVRLEPAAP